MVLVLKSFRKRKPPTKKISSISGGGNPKNASHISGNGVFQSTPRKFLIFQEKKKTQKCLIFPQKKAFLIFRETGKIKFPIFQELFFGAPKVKETTLKIFLIFSGNGTFLEQ